MPFDSGKEPRPPNIPDAFSRLGTAIGNLNEHFERLEESVSSVTRQPDPSGRQDDPPVEAGSAVQATIIDATCKVEALSRRVIDLTNRLDL